MNINQNILKINLLNKKQINVLPMGRANIDHRNELQSKLSVMI